MTQPMAPGAEAPDFTLPSAPDRKLSLTELRGRPVILAWSEVSPIDVNPGADGILEVLDKIGGEK